MSPLLLTLLGFAILAASWLNLVLRKAWLTLPMLAIGAGCGLALATGETRFAFTYQAQVHAIVTLVLIVAVMGAGLAIDRPFSRRGWMSTWRLLAIAMPLTVAAVALAGRWLLDLPIGVAVLLGGIVAPTDPVLARSVQVGPPGTGEEGEVRFALTSEAGLNDGLAFPFVLLGLSLLGPQQGEGWGALAVGWAVRDLAWKILAPLAIGTALGHGLAFVSRRLPARFRLPATRDGIVAVGLGLFAYGLSDLAGEGYGLVAVFATAVTLRRRGGVLEFERRLHDAAEQAERVSMVLVLAAFGAAIAGGLLAPVGWADAGFAALLFLVIRPAACLLAFIGSAVPMRERLAIGLLGIRGLGSFFYVGYAALHGLPQGWDPRLWGTVGLVVLGSVVVHGLVAGPLLQRLDGRSE